MPDIPELLARALIAIPAEVDIEVESDICEHSDIVILERLHAYADALGKAFPKSPTGEWPTEASFLMTLAVMHHLYFTGRMGANEIFDRIGVARVSVRTEVKSAQRYN
jgi:hypothetical protein